MVILSILEAVKFEVLIIGLLRTYEIAHQVQVVKIFYRKWHFVSLHQNIEDTSTIARFSESTPDPCQRTATYQLSRSTGGIRVAK